MTHENARRRPRPLARSLAVATGALILYGSWALLANFDHGWSKAVRAAATQAFASFTITLSMTGLMEALHRTTTAPWSQFTRAASGSIALATSYTLALHWWMGTPQILRTGAPSIIIGSIYSIVYSANLVRESRRSSTAAGSSR